VTDEPSRRLEPDARRCEAGYWSLSPAALIQLVTVRRPRARTAPRNSRASLGAELRTIPHGPKTRARREQLTRELSWLSLRHSWATHAEFHGYGLALIQRVLRHTTERTAATYYRHADVPNLVERVAGFDF
jgi:integrase